MKKKALLLFITIFSTCLVNGQTPNGGVYTSDIENFWLAYDSIRKTPGEREQLSIMKEVYIRKATAGLEAFMTLRNFDEKDLVSVINKYPEFWKSIRSNTLIVKDKETEISRFVTKFKQLYPKFREASIYFCITAIRSGGTTRDSLVLIGTEIATGNAATNVSEFPDKRLENFFKTQQSDNIVPVVIHEYVHTQQKTEGKNLLGQSIYEGACEFITELVLGKELQHIFLTYGRENEDSLKVRFKKEMFSENFESWLYNGSSAKVGDLGYFMGYAICKAYYKQAKDKNKAIAEIITLNYADNKAIKGFLKKSKYFTSQY
ncbi:gliding motility protein GldB-related protein [Sinomicrobium sp. M5D2P9]